MSTLFVEAVEAVTKLSVEEQQALVEFLANHDKDEAQWDETLAETAASLDQWASRIRADHRAGRTEPMDLSKF